MQSLQECQQLCVGSPGCKGIEYSSFGRCEVWTRADGIGATAEAPSYHCLLYSQQSIDEPFLPADGGANRLCRGDNKTDIDTSYYNISGGKTLDECKAVCRATPSCAGIEHNSRGYCEVWTRTGGIGATYKAPTFTCFRYTANGEVSQTRSQVRRQRLRSAFLGTALLQTETSVHSESRCSETELLDA